MIAVGTEQIVADIRARSGLGLVQARELLAATGVSGALGGVGGAVVEPAVVRAAAAVPAPPAVPAVQVEPGMAVAPIVVEPAMAVEQPVAVEPLAAAPPVVAAPAEFEPPSFPPLPSMRPNDKYLSPAAPALAFWPAGPSVADLAALGPVQPHEPYISERDFAAPVAATPPAVPVAPAPIASPAGEVAQPVTPATTAMAPAADSVHATVPVEHAEPAPVVTSARAAYVEPRAESVVPETASPSHDDPAEAARTALIEGIRRIAVEVRNSLEFYVAQGREPVTRAVLCGPALQIEGFDAALSRELGIPVTQGTVALASPRSAGSVPRGMLAVAAGLSVIEGPQ